MTQGERLFSPGKICAWSKKRHALWTGLSREQLETSNNDSSEHETLKELQFCSPPPGVASCSLAPQLPAAGFVGFVFFNCCPCRVFIAAWAFSLVGAGRGHSLVQCRDFSLWWPLWLQTMGSEMHRLQQLWLTRLVAPQKWGLPKPGVKPMSPALAGKEPPGEAQAIGF